MYIDIDYNTLIISLPCSYKSTSNLFAMTDEELENLNIYKINSFIQDDMYIGLLYILGTEYIPTTITALPGVVNPGTDVQIIFDQDLIISQIIEKNKYTGKFSNIQNAFLNRPTEDIKTNEPVSITYDYENSYVIAVFGESELLPYTKPSPTKFKYALMCNSPPTLPNLKIGDIVTQNSGFIGEISYIDELRKVIKIINCSNIDLIDRFETLKLNDYDLGPIFCYELYLKSDDIKYVNPHEETLMDLISQNIFLRNLFSHPDLTYITKYDWIVRDEYDSLVKIESNEFDLSEFNKRQITSYGRYV